MKRPSAARLLVPLAVAIAALTGSCTDVAVSPNAVTALEFDSLPYPAVVTGDTLRDSLGNAAPLRAIAFNGSGNVLPNAPVSFIALDSGLTIDPTGIVTAQVRSGAVRVIASSPGVQTGPQSVLIARRPDTVVATSPTADTVFYVPIDNPSNLSAALTLQVATYDSIGGIPGTQGWLVSYQVIFHGQPLAIMDTSVASLWNAGQQPSLLDTTASDGTVSRSLRVHPLGLQTTIDSVLVVASVRYRGAPVRGSPVTYVIQLQPKPTP